MKERDEKSDEGVTVFSLSVPFFTLRNKGAQEISSDSRSLSDLGNRSEHGGRASTNGHDFEAHSGPYATKNRGHLGRSPISAVDCS